MFGMPNRNGDWLSGGCIGRGGICFNRGHEIVGWTEGEEKRERSGRTSSTVVAFVRGVAEVEVLMKKGLWLRGR